MSESELKQQPAQYLTVLGLDPGYVKFGWSVVRLALDDTRLKIAIIDYGMLRNTITDMKRISLYQITEYENELEAIVSSYKVRLIAMERYQSRGLKGISAELVNVMLGICLSKFKKLDLTLLPPSQWKNCARQNKIDLKKLYLEYKKDLATHEIDSSIMAMYSGFTFLGLSQLSMPQATVKSIIEQSKQTVARQSARIRSKPLIVA
jgi:hypothetical protein